ncbi:tyrosyl-tRNA synthetase [Mycoplasmoides fastidiosum]|uniref:Tyrosine--tRNA ligase n=1 Tax=Mycoplasmoides fastidiosum TaxID=92758 RepID=A0ABU0LZL6_9BACT|nr:tyrosine--tRNA ligase [Mycoplasmoides fastidiosum]MDQ0514151.1 tyrosyl-tRNA synthetase [Mycoplasmoides fastidiosum]UUD37441.1 tyrosine--tRNA ligase [Mycoplasmoides fastidiosum]
MNHFANQAQLLLQELSARKLLADCTSEPKLIAALTANKKTYIGFDPTAQSLHLGNYVGICILKHFKNFGFQTVAVLGGATGLVGDPSFKKSERQLLTLETVQDNGLKIATQLSRYSQCDLVVNNLDFYAEMNLIHFLRDVAKLINVNYLLEKEALSERLKTGLSYTEFTYPLLQGWDFWCLYQKYDVAIQAGGSDQWGNITTGIEIVRKMSQEEQANAVGITFNLLTDYQGQKFGKSEGNALFLDPELTSPSQIYQFLINSADQDVEKYLLALTFIPLAEIQMIVQQHQQNPKLRSGQKKLADQLILDLFGTAELKRCQTMTKLLFADSENDFSVNEYTVLEQNLVTITINKSTKLIELLVQTQLSSSLGEARKLIQANGIKVNNQKVTDVNLIVSQANMQTSYLLLQKGKKSFALVKWQ